MLRVPYPIYVGAGTSAEPVNQSYPLRTICYGTHSGEAVKTQKSTLDLLGPLITSKTRLKLLLRFFLNQNLSGYLQGLSKELDENSNSIRVELNRLEEAGMLHSEHEGRRKLYRVNKTHPLTSDLTSMIRKVTGIEVLVDRVVNRIGDDLKQVWISGRLAMGLESNELEVLLVGEGFDSLYIAELMGKVEEKLEKKVNYSTTPALSTWQKENSLLVWQKQDEQ